MRRDNSVEIELTNLSSFIIRGGSREFHLPNHISLRAYGRTNYVGYFWRVYAHASIFENTVFLSMSIRLHYVLVHPRDPNQLFAIPNLLRVQQPLHSS
jgi:hypothetical protein